MQSWASVASWFLKPENSNPLSLIPQCSVNSSVANNVSRSELDRSNCRVSNDLATLPLTPTICTAIKCTVPGCSCECFAPGKLHIRYCETCSHGWVPHALDKLGFRHIFGQTPVEPVQPNVAFDIASLVLYGCQALPIRLKILLDRLFSVLQKEEVTQILRGFGWNHEDYARGYILQEAQGMVLDRWNICSPEEEPLVLQQFLRFGETRAITQQLLLHGLGDLKALPKLEAEFKRTISEKSTSKVYNPKPAEDTRYKPPNIHHSQSQHPKPRTPSPSDGNIPLSSIQQLAARFPAPPPPLPQSTTHKQSPCSSSPHRRHGLNFLKLPHTGLTCTPVVSVSSTISPIGSPPKGHYNNHPISISPLNKLQSMQPFDFRKMATSALPNSKCSPERRRFSDASETSQPGLNLSVTSPSAILPPPPPPIPFSSSSFSMLPHDLKSPCIDFSSSAAASSEFGGSEDADDEDENSHSALNLSKDVTSLSKVMSKQRHTHTRKASTPMKRQWGSAGLPLNLGTQLINPATGKKRVQCNVCLKTFCDKGALKIHFSAVHLREMHKCTVEGCNMMFSSRRSRNRHSANPNPKLHSPHLRRKISPHDGRSAQAHHLLIPPLQAAGLNPLPFGPFPLLAPPDIRNQIPLDFKHGFNFTHPKQPFISNNAPSSDNNDEYIDDEEEEGIIVDEGEDDDFDDDSETNSGEKLGPRETKQVKLSVSDIEEERTNSDSNDETSVTASDVQIPKEENPKNVHKRKSQKPTRCALQVDLMEEVDLAVSEEDPSDEVGLFHETDVSSFSSKESDQAWNLHKHEEKEGKCEDDDFGFPLKECENNNTKLKILDDEEGQCLNLSTNSRGGEVKNHPVSPQKEANTEQGMNSLKERLHPPIADVENVTTKNNKTEPVDFTLDSGTNSPAKSGESTASCESDYETFDNLDDVPLDKDNPRKCTACALNSFTQQMTNGSADLGQLVYSIEEDMPNPDQNNMFHCRFCSKPFNEVTSIKEHYEQYHLNEMFRCKVPGCMQVFSSRTKRNYHSENMTIHHSKRLNIS